MASIIVLNLTVKFQGDEHYDQRLEYIHKNMRKFIKAFFKKYNWLITLSLPYEQIVWAHLKNKVLNEEIWRGFYKINYYIFKVFKLYIK